MNQELKDRLNESVFGDRFEISDLIETDHRMFGNVLMLPVEEMTHYFKLIVDVQQAYLSYQMKLGNNKQNYNYKQQNK